MIGVKYAYIVLYMIAVTNCRVSMNNNKTTKTSTYNTTIPSTTNVATWTTTFKKPSSARKIIVHPETSADSSTIIVKQKTSLSTTQRITSSDLRWYPSSSKLSRMSPHIANANPVNPPVYSLMSVRKNIFSGVPVVVKVSIFIIGQPFNNSITDISSKDYIALKTRLTKRLEMLTKSGSEFVSLDIDSLSDGSGDLEIQGKKLGILKVDNSISTKSVNLSSSLHPGNRTLDEIKNITKIVLVQAEIKITLCGIGFDPDEGLHLCISKCAKYQCFNGGECLLTLDGKTICSCRSEENFVYTGDHCDVKTEKYKLGRTYIIAIAGGGGGLLCIILIVVCGVCIHRGRISSKDNAQYQDDQSIYDQPMSVVGGQKDSPNVYVNPKTDYEHSTRYNDVIRYAIRRPYNNVTEYSDYRTSNRPIEYRPDY